jgi:hypothetical protein
MVTAVFASGTAGLVFLEKLLHLVKQLRKTVEARLPGGRVAILITPTTSRREIEEFCRRV